ncbi:hypothetical protein DFH07DRAFT_1014332 [Mycena maculata]|uniref:F-box domain-containing protein n=1 Tax=Mycena maculata TaxID=230809 RepID=A0AAD7JJK8_9AGAR|nr:hypothetical protein DFH07DRAFT_1014332 [Mycena maculata]
MICAYFPTTMTSLPNELVDRICSFLRSRDLWAMVRVSSRFRRLAMFPFLSRFGISHSNIQAGTISLSDSFFVILVVAHICPIQRLICFKEPGPTGQLRYKRLASILAITAPIPDIVIYNRQYMLQRTRRETVYLLARIPQAANTTFLIIKGNSTYLSRPRSTPPIRWKLLPPPLNSTSLSTTMKVLVVLFGIPLLFAYLVSAFINFGVVLVWAYRLLVGPAWPQDDRIASDAGLLVFDDWMRIQALPEKFTLVTLTEQRAPVFALRPIPGLTDAVYSSLLSSLDLGFYLQRLTVEAHTNIPHAELMAFLHRHPHLTHLSCEPHSILPSSLVSLPTPPKSQSKISTLTAPAPYIPHLLPAAPNIQRICIFFPPANKAALLSHAAFDAPAYRDALAALPAHPLSLTLALPLATTGLPWTADAEARAAAPATVHELVLCRDGPARFRAGTIRALAPWLGLFPGLRRVVFVHGAVERIPPAQRAELAEAICAACPGMSGTQDVAFNIMDD